jgi:hypothetical protein
MTVSAPASNLGRHLFGVAIAAWGVITLAWHDGSGITQPFYHGWISLYSIAIVQILGGVLLQFPRTARSGASGVGTAFLFFAILCVPFIFEAPQTYNNWGNFFEQLTIVTGAAIVYARLSSGRPAAMLLRIARVLVAICVTSFALEQAFYLDNTASLVPKWLPPGQMFWAEATTVAFALAALALLTNRRALLASRLVTAMLVLFGLLVWLPMLLANPHSHNNWSEFAETFAIAGVAWILAELLGEDRDQI